MNKIVRGANIVYYIFYPFIFVGLFLILSFVVTSIVPQVVGVDDGGFGAAILTVYIMILIVAPALIIILMRFSLFPHYFDPIAAIEIPILFYLYLLISEISSGNSIMDAIAELNFIYTNNLSAVGCCVFLFSIGLISSFSPKRKKMNNISYRFLRKQKLLPPYVQPLK